MWNKIWYTLYAHCNLCYRNIALKPKYVEKVGKFCHVFYQSHHQTELKFGWRCIQEAFYAFIWDDHHLSWLYNSEWVLIVFIILLYSRLSSTGALSHYINHFWLHIFIVSLERSNDLLPPGISQKASSRSLSSL